MEEIAPKGPSEDHNPIGPRVFRLATGNHRPGPDEVKRRIVEVRLTDKEHSKLSRFCEAHGLTMSDFGRLSMAAAMREASRE